MRERTNNKKPNTRTSIKSKGKAFWDKEYDDPQHLRMSLEPSSDLQKFLRWNERRKHEALNLDRWSHVLDLGCGNGRNLIYLAEVFNMSGVGYDISEHAITQARTNSSGAKLTYEARTIAGTYPNIPDESCDLVLDMMTSHFLKEKEREVMISEILRVLKPGGFLFLKTFLADEDLHVKRLLRDNPADEEGAYIHPEMGVYEHVYSEAELKRVYGAHFDIHKIEKSHKHISKGKAFKRRSITVYLEKRW